MVSKPLNKEAIRLNLPNSNHSSNNSLLYLPGSPDSPNLNDLKIKNIHSQNKESLWFNSVRDVGGDTPLQTSGMSK